MLDYILVMNQLNRISESEYEKLLAKLIIENLPLISTTIKFSNKEISRFKSFAFKRKRHIPSTHSK